MRSLKNSDFLDSAACLTHEIEEVAPALRSFLFKDLSKLLWRDDGFPTSRSRLLDHCNGAVRNELLVNSPIECALNGADRTVSGDPTQQTLLELGRLDRREDRAEPIMRRNDSTQIQKLRQPLPLGTSSRGDGHEVVRSTHDRTHRNRHNVDKRIGRLSSPGVRQCREMVLDRNTHSLGHDAHPETRTPFDRPASNQADVSNRHPAAIASYPASRNRHRGLQCISPALSQS